MTGQRCAILGASTAIATAGLFQLAAVNFIPAFTITIGCVMACVTTMAIFATALRIADDKWTETHTCYQCQSKQDRINTLNGMIDRRDNDIKKLSEALIDQN